MAAYQSKYQVGLNSVGYIISQKNGVRYYQKKRAPSFVNKMGSGDSSYRDATFWQFFVQTNWRNGSKQLKFDDPGKFWKSENVDTTTLDELTLSKTFESAGQLAAGVKVNALEAWRSSANWWNANYGYRQQLTITNSASASAPVGLPVKVTIDTAALETATKLRSDRKDWRILYFNGSSWVDLGRDYVSTTATFFALQTAIAAGGSDSNYYAYYGYASESTTKQPSTEAEWNAVYGMYGVTPDANSVGVWHFKEGTGTSVADDSASTNTGTASGSPAWGTDGKFGRYMTFDDTNDYVDVGANGSLNLGSLTVEGWFYGVTTGENVIFAKSKDGEVGTPAYGVFVVDGRIKTRFNGGGFSTTTNTVPTNTWTHFAVTHDGATTCKIYINGTLIDTVTQDASPSNSTNAYIGQNGAGSQYLNGRLQHLRVSNVARTSFPYVLSADPSISAGTETTTQPPASTFDLYGGGSDGKVYKWDGTTTWTEQFDCSRILWYETGNDANEIVGDEGGTEKAKSQGFQLPVGQTISGASFYLKKNAGTPGDITVRIETDSTNKPSGTLAHSNATGTITAFSTTSYGWVSVTFAGTFSLSATTTYHLVLKTAAAANDQNYAWAADASSPTLSSGAQSYSADGGSTWTADSTKDQYFRLNGQATEINAMKVTSIGGTQKLYIGTGDPDGQTNGDARLYSYDGTNWTLVKSFATSTESAILSIEEYTANTKVYLGIAPQAKVYETSDFSTFTLSKDINVPQNPGYPWAIKEYNRVLHVGGGSPEFLPTQYFNGFLNVYDTTAWNILYPFDFTVISSLEFYDAYLFMGTYHGQLYVYDTATLNPLFSFKDQYAYQVDIKAMKYFDDKLYIGLYPQFQTGETNVGIWVFDRRGITLAHTISGVTGYRCFAVVNGLLMVGTGDNGYVYKLNPSVYKTQGYYQSSYFDANLPSIDKLYKEVTIRHDPLVTGQTINVYYKFKESDSWTQLTTGADNSVGAIEQTLSFASGIYSKKVTLKIELNTTNTANSPKLTEVIMKYTLYPPLKWQWNLRLKAKQGMILLDKTTDARTAEQIRGTLEALMNSQQLYTYVDIDGTSYDVLVNDIDQTSWVINQDTTNEDEVLLTLLEA